MCSTPPKGLRRKEFYLNPQLVDSSNCSNFSTHPLPLSTRQLICPAHASSAKYKLAANVSYLYSACVSPVSLLNVEALLSPLVMVVREERL